jgi:hypothetical protein
VSLLPECPVCFGLLTRSKRSTLSSACRCPFPDEVTRDEFPGLREERADLEPKERPDGRWQVAA